MFNNKLCKMLGIKYPIIQGGMAWVANYNLAQAVSNAGGLGIIGAGGLTRDELREEIRKTRELTDKPFGVNIVISSRNIQEVVDLLCEEKVDVVTTGAGNPLPYIEEFKEAGIKIIPLYQMSD